MEMFTKNNELRTFNWGCKTSQLDNIDIFYLMVENMSLQYGIQYKKINVTDN